MHNGRKIRAALAAFKGNSKKIMYVNWPTPPLQNFRGLSNTKNVMYAVSLTPHARTRKEFKKALACESGVQGGLFDEKKNEGRKSRDTVPLN
jgi:hypothetical protein